MTVLQPPMRPCAVCGDPFTNIDTEWVPYNTVTATGWHFDQHEQVHTHLCAIHHNGIVETPMPRMVAYFKATRAS